MSSTDGSRHFFDFLHFSFSPRDALTASATSAPSTRCRRRWQSRRFGSSPLSTTRGIWVSEGPSEHQHTTTGPTWRSKCPGTQLVFISMTISSFKLCYILPLSDENALQRPACPALGLFCPQPIFRRTQFLLPSIFSYFLSLHLSADCSLPKFRLVLTLRKQKLLLMTSHSK